MTRYHVELTIDLPSEWTEEMVRHHVRQIAVTSAEIASIRIKALEPEATAGTSAYSKMMKTFNS
jgi:hypothetical protein